MLFVEFSLQNLGEDEQADNIIFLSGSEWNYHLVFSRQKLLFWWTLLESLFPKDLESRAFSLAVAYFCSIFVWLVVFPVASIAFFVMFFLQIQAGKS